MSLVSRVFLADGRTHWPWWAPLAIAPVSLALLAAGALTGADDLLGDATARWTPAPARPPMIVAIGDESLRQLGKWPLPRRHYGELLRRLHARGAQAVAFDILFDRPAPDPADDLLLAAALRETGVGVLATVLQPVQRMDGEMQVRTEVEVRPPTAVLAAACPRAGFVNVTGPGEEAGRIRHCRLRQEAAGQQLESLPLSTARLLGMKADPPAGLSRIRWAGSTSDGRFRLFEMVDILGNLFDPGDLAGVPVLVGASSRSLGDVKETPLGEIPGVEVNANVVCDLMGTGFVRTLSGPAAAGGIVAVALLAALVLGFAPAAARPLGALYFAGLLLLVPMLASRGLLAAQAAILAMPSFLAMVATGRRAASQGSVAELFLALDQREPAQARELARSMEEGPTKDAALALVALADGEPDAASRLLDRLELALLDGEMLYRLGDALSGAGRWERAREFFSHLHRRDVGFRDVGQRFLDLDTQLALAASVLGPEAIQQTLAAVFSEVERVAAGGSGLLYRCLEGGEPVAVKVLDPRLVASGEALARFRREIAILEVLEHPGIVRFRGAVLGKLCYYRMDFVEGESLAARLAAGWRPAAQEAARLLAEAAEAMAHAHEAGVLHRDLKPSNLMLRRDGRLILVDFGVARLEGADRLTREGTFVGTMTYAAPEQLRGEAVDERADVYGLGAVWRELGIPSLASLVEQMTALDPAIRPGTMREVAARAREIEQAPR